MSRLVYNGVEIPYVQVTSFQQTALLDDSNTDLMYIKFDIQCQGILNANYMVTVAPGLVEGGAVVTNNPADIKNYILPLLMVPRKSLALFVNGVNVIPTISGNKGTVDARNGPQPQACNVLELTATSFLVTYHIIAHYFIINSSAAGKSPVVTNQNIGNNVLNNRWSESVDIDNCNYTKRTREGSFVIRSDNPSGVIADTLRANMAVVGVPQGFLRENSTYKVSPDGLALYYRITDREVFKNPPGPAYQAEGYYAETLTRNRAVVNGECHVSLKGAKNSDQNGLVAAALGIAASKIQQRGGWQVTDYVSAKIGLYDNTAEATIRRRKGRDVARTGATSLIEKAQAATSVFALGAAASAIFNITNIIQGKSQTTVGGGAGGTPTQPPASIINKFNTFAGMADATPLSDGGGWTPPYPPNGTALYLLQAAAYYDPSFANTTVNAKTSQLTAGTQVGQAGRYGE